MSRGPLLRAPFAGLLLGCAVFLGAGAGLALRMEPFHTWFFCFAWWSYILAAESWLRLTGGESLLWERPGEWALLPPLSVVLWLFFELLNFRLGNWRYAGLPHDAALRWAGYALSFATVLPGLFATAAVLDRLGAFRSARLPPLKNPQRLAMPLVFAGTVLLVLPLHEPRWFFPLVWAALVPLCDPLAALLGGRSFLADWERGEPRRALLLLAAGLVCGLLWESWNWWAGARWIYSVPLPPALANAKLFEMPVLGYLGFPPFALECAVAANLFFAARERLRQEPAARRRVVTAVAMGGAAVFSAAVMAGIDAHTWTGF
jgi:hypothetical protein